MCTKYSTRRPLRHHSGQSGQHNEQMCFLSETEKHLMFKQNFQLISIFRSKWDKCKNLKVDLEIT